MRLLDRVRRFMDAARSRRAGRLSEVFKPFVGTPVVIRVWGEALPIPPGATTSIDSTRSVGAGFHLYLSVDGDAQLVHIKSAQPAGVTTDATSLVIAGAKYVQCDGRTLSRGPNAPAFEVQGSK